MINALGRVAAFFALLFLFVVWELAGLAWWVNSHIPPDLTTPEQIQQYKFAASNQPALFPLLITVSLFVAALVAFKPRSQTIALAGVVSLIMYFSLSHAVKVQPPQPVRSLPPPASLASNRPVTAPVPPAAPLPEPSGPQPAPPGVFYLLTPAHVETRDGIIGLPPGTRVTLVRPGLYLTPAGKTSLDEKQLTNDLGIARTATANDRTAQANLRAKAQAVLRARPVDTIMEHGTRKVPAQINGILTKNFVIDSGASSVALPSGVVDELMQTGTLTESDFRGTVVSVIADGSRSKHRMFILHSIRVGDATIPDVVATDDGPNGPLLLGMTFLTKAKAIYDTANGKLIFNP